VAVGALVAGVVVVNLVGLRRPCADGRTTLTVATGSGLYAALDQLARAFAASQRGGCVAVNLVRAESADVAATLRPVWSGATRPDVWIPDSWLWLRLAAARPEAGRLLPDSPTSIASSPVVLAVRRPVAERLGWPAQPLTWSAALAATKEPPGEPRLATADPTRTTEGMAFALRTLDADGDGSVDDDELVAGTAFTRRLATVAIDSSAFFGEPGSARPEPATAPVDVFPALERDVAVFDAAAPPEPLVPAYPGAGGIVANYPYAVLRAAWVDDARRRLADRFQRYLLEPDSERVLARDGFRDPGGSAVGVPQLVPDRGFDPRSPASTAMSPVGVNQVLGEWTALRRPANLVVALDTAASMNQSVPGTPTSRLDLLRRTALAGVNTLTSETSIGLWQFATGVTPGAGHRELVPYGPVTGTVGETPRPRALTDAVNGLTAGGDSTLYDTTYAAFHAVQKTWRPVAVNAVIVVTDGWATDAGSLPRADLIGRLAREARPDRPVTMVFLAVGGRQDADALREISAAVGGGAFLVRYPDAAIRALVLALAGRLP